MIQDTVDTYVDMCFSDDVDSEEWDLNEFNGVLTPIIPIRPLTAESVKGKKRDEIRHELKEEAVKLYEEKEAEFPEPEQLRELERVVLLKCIDSKWMDHIDDMEILRQGIGLAAYGQRDPVVEYKMSAFDMFNEMITSIQEDTLRMLYHVHVEQKIERDLIFRGEAVAMKGCERCFRTLQQGIIRGAVRDGNRAERGGAGGNSAGSRIGEGIVERDGRRGYLGVEPFLHIRGNRRFSPGEKNGEKYQNSRAKRSPPHRSRGNRMRRCREAGFIE